MSKGPRCFRWRVNSVSDCWAPLTPDEYPDPWSAEELTELAEALEDLAQELGGGGVGGCLGTVTNQAGRVTKRARLSASDSP